jgi:hypothetical protein
MLYVTAPLVLLQIESELRRTRWDAVAPKSALKLKLGITGPRRHAVRDLIDRCTNNTWCPEGRDIYQFGVYTGRSMKAIASELLRSNVSYHKMWGFDSFQGIPPEVSHRNRTVGYGNLLSSVYKDGAYNAADVLGVHSLVGIQAKLEQFIASTRPVGWIAGYYDQSLTTTLSSQRCMRPAMYVDIDCDIYSSTKVVLRWLFENRLIVRGTVLAYDDLIDEAGGYSDGEGLAHTEIMAQYSVKARLIKDKCCWEIISYTLPNRTDSRRQRHGSDVSDV